MFLLGMRIMSDGLRNAAGDKLRVILEKSTSNRFAGVGIGAGVTAVIQSSAATIAMAMSFVSSGLMLLSQSVGVTMGANIGTTITSQITAFHIDDYAPFILFFGAIMFLFLKKKMLQHIGSVIMGFGLLFVGVTVMKEAIAPLAQSAVFMDALATLENPVLAVLFGILFTAIVQSSSSSVVIFQTFCMQGLISFDIAVYLCLGAAIGSTTPILLGSLTLNRNGKRVALIDLLFNIGRLIIIVLLINIWPGFLDFIKSLSPDDISRQVANCHTAFAIVACIVELPFIKYIVKLSQLIIPLHESEKRVSERKLVFLTNTDSRVTPVAVTLAKKEVCRMGKLARDNLALSIEAFFDRDRRKTEAVYENEDTVDYLDNEITKRMVKLRTLDLTPKDTQRLSNLFLTISNMERISDHAENIAEYADKMIEKKVTISPEAMSELRDLADATVKSIDICLQIFDEERFDLMPQAYEQENRVDDLQDTATDSHIKRLMEEKCDPMGGVFFTDMGVDLERCSDHAINIAESLMK